MSNSPEHRGGRDAESKNEQNWENQMSWGREDKGAETHVRQPSTNSGVIHFVRDIKTWESDHQAMTVNFLESGITSLGSSSKMVRYHTKVPVSWGKSVTTADSKTKQSTYTLKGFPPVKFTTIGGTFVTTMLGEGVEPTFSGDPTVILRSNKDKQEFSISNKTKKWKIMMEGGKEGPEGNLPEGDFTFELRYNAVRSKYEIYGYDPNELVGPGGDYNRDKFSRYILFETSELTPGGVTKFTPVLETLSTKTFEMTLADIPHKIKTYVVPAGISAESLDMWQPGNGINQEWAEKCSNESSLINDTITKTKEKAAKQKEEADAFFKAYTKAAGADKPAESIGYYEAELRSIKIKKADNNEAQDLAAEAQATATARKELVEKFKKICFERNGFEPPKGSDECHDNCTKYCDEIANQEAIITEKADERKALKAEAENLEAQETAATKNLEDRKSWEETLDEERAKYDEMIRSWRKTLKAAEDLEEVEAILKREDAFVKDSSGCE